MDPFWFWAVITAVVVANLVGAALLGAILAWGERRDQWGLD